jgi:hypothetical protein
MRRLTGTALDEYPSDDLPEHLHPFAVAARE